MPFTTHIWCGNLDNKETIIKQNQGSGNGDIQKNRSCFMEAKTIKYRSNGKKLNEKRADDINK